MDQDGSGRISFDELDKYVRGNPHQITGALGIPKNKLTEVSV